MHLKKLRKLWHSTRICLDADALSRTGEFKPFTCERSPDFARFTRLQTTMSWRASSFNSTRTSDLWLYPEIIEMHQL